MNKKNPWASRTIWLNSLILTASVCGVLTSQDLVKDYPTIVAGLLVAQSIANLCLRFVTKQPIR